MDTERRAARHRKIVLLGLILTFVAACNRGETTTTSGAGSETTAAGSGETLRVAVLMSNAGDPYFSNKSYGYAQYADQDPNIELEFFNAGGYDHLDVQLSQIENAVQSQFDVLLITPVDSAGVCEVAREAVDAGAVVVADDTGMECDYKVPFFVTENSYQVGFAQCTFIAERQGRSGGMVAIWGPAGPAHIQRRQEGCRAALEQYPDVTLLGEQFSQTSGIDDGLTLTENFITQFGDEIKGLYTAGSVLATGASQALEGAGYAPGDVTLVGIDLTEESLQTMEEGWFQGIQASQPVRVAYLVTKYGVALARGETDIPGGQDVFECCERVLLTTDWMVITPEMYRTFPTDLALAPPGWRPPV